MKTKQRNAQLPPSLWPYLLSGRIVSAFVSAGIRIEIEEDAPVRLGDEFFTRPLHEMWDADACMDTSVVVLSHLSEVAAIRERQIAGAPPIPSVHLELECPAVDIVEISIRYSYHENFSGYRRSGHSHPFDVSVIVPVYNVEKYVEKCAESLLSQDFAGRLEVIFVDDGGSDSSVEKIRSMIKGHDDAIILHKANGGAADARNFGLSASRGEFIAFVDGDDYVAENFVSVLFRTALLNNVDVAQGGFAYVNAATGEIKPHKESFHTTSHIGVVADPAFPLMLQTPGIWRRLYSKHFLDRNGIAFNPAFRRHDDLPFNIEVLTCADRVGIARDVIYFYLLGRDGQDVGATDERLFIHFRLFEYTVKALGSKLWTRHVHRVFLRTMIKHHLWAYDRIHGSLKPAYLRGLVHQLIRIHGPLRVGGRVKLLRKELRGKGLLFVKSIGGFMSWKRPDLPSDL